MTSNRRHVITAIEDYYTVQGTCTCGYQGEKHPIGSSDLAWANAHTDLANHMQHVAKLQMEGNDTPYL